MLCLGGKHGDELFHLDLKLFSMKKKFHMSGYVPSYAIVCREYLSEKRKIELIRPIFVKK